MWRKWEHDDTIVLCEIESINTYVRVMIVEQGKDFPILWWLCMLGERFDEHGEIVWSHPTRFICSSNTTSGTASYKMFMIINTWEHKHRRNSVACSNDSGAHGGMCSSFSGGKCADLFFSFRGHNIWGFWTVVIPVSWTFQIFPGFIWS